MKEYESGHEVYGMTECESFGMSCGCAAHCPVLVRGECEVFGTVEKFLEQEDTDEG